MADRLMNAAPHDGIATGSCVMLIDEEITYAGPLKSSPDATGKLVLLSHEDFNKFKAHVEKKRH